MFFNKDDAHLLTEGGFLKSDINRLTKEIKIILMEQNEENLAYKKYQGNLISRNFQISKWNNILNYV